MYKVAPVKCIQVYTLGYIAAGMSIFQDLIVLLLPLPTLWKLNLRWQKKCNLLVMFSVGSFVIMCSLLRLRSLTKLNDSSDPSCEYFSIMFQVELKLIEVLDDRAPIIVWTNLETGVGVICGCLPAFRSLVGYIFPSLKMILGPSSGNDTPAYPTQSRSNNKMDRKRLDSSTRVFIELDDQMQSQDELVRGAVENRSIVSQNSETPIHEKLVPYNSENGYGCSAKVDVRDLKDPRVKTGSGDEII